MRKKTALPVVAASALALGAAIGGASPVAASSRPVTVKSVTASNITANGGCRTSTIRVYYSAEPRLDDVSFEVEVWKGSHFLGTEFVDEPHRGYASGSYYWCNYEGIGTFRLKRLAVEWWDYEADDYTGTYGDSHTASFQVKQASRVTMTSLTRTKTSRTATAKRLMTAVVRNRYYRSSAYAWTNWKSHYVYLQRKTNTGWKSVKRATTNTKGVATLRYVAPLGQPVWRVYTPGNKTIRSDVSGQIRR